MYTIIITIGRDKTNNSCIIIMTLYNIIILYNIVTCVFLICIVDIIIVL